MLFDNLISCIILVLILRLVRKLTNRVTSGSGGATAKNKINTLITGSHIIVILICTITQTIISFTKENVKLLRMSTAFFIITGLADLFLSLMLWLILDDTKVPDVFVDGNRVYTVTEIIMSSHSSINSDSQNE